MAKDLIRTRRYNQRFRDIRTNIQGVVLNMQSSRSQQQMAESMKVATTVIMSSYIFPPVLDQLTLQLGNAWHEQNHEHPQHAEDNDRVREGEHGYGDEGGNDVRRGR